MFENFGLDVLYEFMLGHSIYVGVGGFHPISFVYAFLNFNFAHDHTFFHSYEGGALEVGKEVQYSSLCLDIGFYNIFNYIYRNCY
jgi:hypothetical protein